MGKMRKRLREGEEGSSGLRRVKSGQTTWQCSGRGGDCKREKGAGLGGGCGRSEAGRRRY